jgi:hypothetical protein
MCTGNILTEQVATFTWRTAGQPLQNEFYPHLNRNPGFSIFFDPILDIATGPGNPQVATPKMSHQRASTRFASIPELLRMMGDVVSKPPVFILPPSSAVY